MRSWCGNQSVLRTVLRPVPGWRIHRVVKFFGGSSRCGSRSWVRVWLDWPRLWIWLLEATRLFSKKRVPSWAERCAAGWTAAITSKWGVFFFNYANLFALMRKVGAIESALATPTSSAKGGDLRELDFRFVRRPFNGLKAFFTTSPGLTSKVGPRHTDCARPRGLRGRCARFARFRQLPDWFVGHGGSIESIAACGIHCLCPGVHRLRAISARCMLTTS